MGKKKAPEADARVLDIGETRLIPFDCLALSPLNVRKVDINHLDELVASISSIGLLHPLIGYVVDDAAGLVNIAAGQRRYRALKQLNTPGETLIPVVIKSEEDALEISLAENLERRQMNPADEARAFKALLDLGTHNVESIAKRFGLPLNHVRRRCKIATLHDEILVALAKGAITIDSAEAYAATDDQVLQLRIFKAQEKSTWQPHKVSSILIEIRDQGIRADGPVGKFIGGRKAYEKAGGSVGVDEAFMPLFETIASPGAMEEVRLTDMALVRTLINTAIAKHDKAMEKAALEQYPFVDGVEWMDLLLPTHSRKPDLPKKSELTFVAPDYSNPIAGIVKRAKKAKDKEGAQVLAIIDVDHEGKPFVAEGKFVVGKDGWLASATKEQKQQSSGYKEPTPEERAAAERARRVANVAANLLGRSLIGETPGFVVTNVQAEGVAYRDERPRLQITLEPLDPAIVNLHVSKGDYRYELKPESLAPFVADAEAKLDGILEAEAMQVVNEQRQREADLAAANALLDELETTAIVDWPTRVAIEGDFGLIEIQRIAIDGAPVLSVSTDEEQWESDNVLETMATIRDGMAEAGAFTVERQEEADATVEELNQAEIEQEVNAPEPAPVEA